MQQQNYSCISRSRCCHGLCMMVVVAAHRSRPAGTGGLCVRHTDVGTGQLAARHPASPGPGLHRRSRHQVQEEEGSGSKFRHCTCTTSFHPTTAINGYATSLAGLRHPPSKHCHTWLSQGLSVVRQPSSNHCHNWLHHTPHWFLLHPSSKHCCNWPQALLVFTTSLFQTLP